MRLIDTKYGKVLSMSFVEAEHCGIKLGDIEMESALDGINLGEELPLALLIQFDGGFIVTPKTKPSTIAHFHIKTCDFHSLEELMEGKDGR